MAVQVIQEIKDTLIGQGIAVGDVISTSYYALLDCSYGKTGNIRSTILFHLSPYNVTGSVDMHDTNDATITLTIKNEHLEDGKNNILFAKRVASICKVLKETTHESRTI